MPWTERHGDIFRKYCDKLNAESIRYFILRNYNGLPELNKSKDVDIVVDPLFFSRAKILLKEVYRDERLPFYYEARFGYLHCCHGIDVGSGFGIHIDLIGSYVSKGAEIFTFEELYFETKKYRNFYVLNEYFEGVMVFIYKLFGYSRPILKEEYKAIIFDTYTKYPQFKTLLEYLIGQNLAGLILASIAKKDFEAVLNLSSELTRSLKSYSFRKNPFRTTKNTCFFYLEKFDRIVFGYAKYSKVFAVIAPDGAGKTTFIETVIKLIERLFVNDESDERCHVYHFRPNLIPNLGEVGEKVGFGKQDKDFTDPHRSRPASAFSSFLRLLYYWLDYVAGYNLLIRRDVQYDRFSIFDRYSYDLLVDPGRTRLALPDSVRRFFVKFMPHPKVVFYLDAPTEIIHARKQELTESEIERQNTEYKKLVQTHRRFVALDSSRPANKIASEAAQVLLERFAEKIDLSER